jgi:hypothetical protein
MNVNLVRKILLAQICYIEKGHLRLIFNRSVSSRHPYAFIKITYFFYSKE